MQDKTPFELINKALNNEISDAEHSRLDAWLLSHPKNQELFDEMKEIWSSSKSYTPKVEFDRHKAFERFKIQHIQSGEIKQEKIELKTRARLFSLWPSSFSIQIAAFGIICLIAFFSWRQFLYNPVIIHSNAPGAIAEILLPDGSLVWLNGESFISHSKRFTGKQRDISFSGNGYFEVSKDSERPFTISLDQNVIQVLGTSFQVDENSVNGLEVSVDEGHVRVVHKITEDAVDLKTGTRGIFDNSDNTFKIEALVTPNHAAWKNKGLSFVATPLQIVIEDIANFYKVEIQYNLSAMKNYSWTSPNLGNTPLDSVLVILENNFPLNITKLSEQSFDLKIK